MSVAHAHSFTPWKTFEICSDTCSTQIIFYWGDCLCIIDYSIDWLIYVFKLDNAILLKKHILFLVTSRNIMFGNIIWFAVILHISDNFDITCSLDIISPRKEVQLWPKLPFIIKCFFYINKYNSGISFQAELKIGNMIELIINLQLNYLSSAENLVVIFNLIDP